MYTPETSRPLDPLPNQMPTWIWKTWRDRPYLTCDLLADFPHGFFTRHWSPQQPADLTPALHPDAPAYRLRQVHGNTVLTPQDIQSGSSSPDGEMPDGDGVATDAANQGAWVCTADCVPALIADVRTGQVAAVHAGWRGTAAKIVPRAIARLEAQGSRQQDLRVALGPAIEGTVYQVKTAVAAEVGATILPDDADVDADASLTQRPPDGVEAMVAKLQRLSAPPILPDPQPGHVRLDVRQVNRLQLLQLGLMEAQIAIAPYCTYQTPDYFFSYRRSAEKKVQWSGIISLDTGSK